MTDSTSETRRSGAVVFRAALAAWTRIAHAIGNVQARIVLTLVYFVAVGPFALIARSRRERDTTSTFWYERKDVATTLDGLRKQF